MNIGRILFLAIFLFCASTILAVGAIFSEVKAPPIFTQEELEQQEMAKKQAELKQEYQQKLVKLLEEYSAKENSFQLEARLGELEQALLSLTVPAQYQNLHLQLVASLERIQGKVLGLSAVRQSFETIIKEYSWLASTLSLFIINNFS